MVTNDAATLVQVDKLSLTLEPVDNKRKNVRVKRNQPKRKKKDKSNREGKNWIKHTVASYSKFLGIRSFSIREELSRPQRIHKDIIVVNSNAFTIL